MGTGRVGHDLVQGQYTCRDRVRQRRDRTGQDKAEQDRTGQGNAGLRRAEQGQDQGKDRSRALAGVRTGARQGQSRAGHDVYGRHRRPHSFSFAFRRAPRQGWMLMWAHSTP